MLNRRAKAAFSMAELLVVVGIMSILVAVSVTNIQGLSKGGNITMAGNMLADLGSQARQHAIATGRRTALVVVKSSTKDTNDPIKPKIALRTFCVMDYDPTDTDKPWKMVTRWMSLPVGVTIANTSESASFLNNTPAVSDFTRINQTAKYLGEAYTLTALGCQVFLPDGSMEPTSISSVDPRKLRVASVQADQANNYYDIIFNAYTGTVKVVRPEDATP